MAGIQAAGWLEVAADHPFGLQTLPYGTFTTRDRPTEPRTGVAIGDRVLDLSAATYRLLTGRADLFSAGYLNTFLDAGHDLAVQRRIPRGDRGPAGARRAGDHAPAVRRR